MSIVQSDDHDALIQEARGIIQYLMDVQNGCPLPKYEYDYRKANAQAEAFLKKTEER